MADVAQEYLVPDGTSIEDIKALIRARVRFTEDPVHDVTRRFFDSFDWRLYRVGASVEEQLVADCRRLLWQDLRFDTADFDARENRAAFRDLFASERKRGQRS